MLLSALVIGMQVVRRGVCFEARLCDSITVHFHFFSG